MKKYFSFLASTLFFALLLFACQKEKIATVAIDQPDQKAFYYTPDISDFQIDIPDENSRASLRSGYFTLVPAGSVDALTDAIAGADPGGIIYLESGLHTENQRVMVTKKVNIIGADGAVLMVDSDPSGSVVNPGIHVLNAPGTMIKNVDIRASQGDGWCAVLLENSIRTAVLQTKMSNFDRALIVEYSDQTALINNEFLDCKNNGVLVNNGKSAYLAGNTFKRCGTNALWACDRWGTLENNLFDANAWGVLLCNWPSEFGITTPSGAPLGADFTCTGWKLRNNKFVNQLYTGLVIRDAANNNLIESNNSYNNNASYDIHIPADEDIPNFIFIPAAYDNTIHAGPEVLIKDCGINTTIFGGKLVDLDQDPC